MEKILCKKYFEGEHEKIVDKIGNSKGSPIWKLLKATTPIIQDNLS
jgi:hypothetical protein